MKIQELFSKKRKEYSTYIVAEIGQNHDGSLGQAHAYIDAAAACGVDAVKFQTHIACEESSKQEPFRVNFSYEDNTRYEYWRRMEFTEEQWRGLYEHAIEMGMEFLSSPFSVKALQILDRIGVPAWKFGSGEVFNDMLIEEAIKTKKPIILSTGLSTIDEINAQIKKIQSQKRDVSILQCTTAYPSRPEEIDVNMITSLKQKYSCPIGLSDHSGTIYPSLAAVTLGAEIIEVHFTMSRLMFGPDVKASVTPDDLKRIVEGAKFINSMSNHPTDKNKRDNSREELKQIFSKSIYAKCEIAKGQLISEDMISLKKPCIGIPANEYKRVIGHIAKVDIEIDTPIMLEDID